MNTRTMIDFINCILLFIRLYTKCKFHFSISLWAKIIQNLKFTYGYLFYYEFFCLM